jgi:hypothetical protein
MEELFSRVWENMSDRVSGPMWLRTILQPAVAIFFAARDGLNDARLGGPPYLWKVFFMAMLMDTIYQLIVQHWIYPLEIVLVAIILAVVPYIVIRGPLHRILSRFITPKKTKPQPTD